MSAFRPPRHRNSTEDERALLNHVSMWGSAGYPINKAAGRWTWGPWRSVQGPPTRFKTKREAVASFERFYEMLLDITGDEARERYLAEHPEQAAAFKFKADEETYWATAQYNEPAPSPDWREK